MKRNIYARFVAWPLREGRRGGFTFIEVLLVVGIVAVVATVSLLTLTGYRGQRDLLKTTQQIATTLREAQARAMAQDQGSAWGVHFNNDSASPFFALFFSDVFNSSTAVGYYPLPNSLAFNSSTFPVGASSSIIFRQISGELDTARSKNLLSAGQIPFSLNVALTRSASGGPQQSSTIDVSSVGRIQFVALSCLLTCSQTSVTLPPPAPTLHLAADPPSVNVLGSSVISWSSAGATSCAAAWTNSTAPSGSVQVVKLSQTTTYSMTCTGVGGATTESVTVTVSWPLPVVTLTANPSSIQTGDSSALSWSTTFANSCSATWTNSTAPNGSQAVRPSKTTTYSITCTGQGGQTTGSATVTVSKKVRP